MNIVMESGSNCNIYEPEFCTCNMFNMHCPCSESAVTVWKHTPKVGNVCSAEADPMWSYCSHTRVPDLCVVGWIP